jgi:hypothetical protein
MLSTLLARMRQECSRGAWFFLDSAADQYMTERLLAPDENVEVLDQELMRVVLDLYTRGHSAPAAAADRILELVETSTIDWRPWVDRIRYSHHMSVFAWKAVIRSDPRVLWETPTPLEYLERRSLDWRSRGRSPSDGVLELLAAATDASYRADYTALLGVVGKSGPVLALLAPVSRLAFLGSVKRTLPAIYARDGDGAASRLVFQFAGIAKIC